MPRVVLCSWALLGLFGMFASPAPAQERSGDRIWARVSTKSGERYEGFVRWERTKASWADVLRGSSGWTGRFYDEWRQAAGGKRPVRVVELMGYRVSWDEDDPDFPSEGELGIRFGHIRRLAVSDSGYVRVEFRQGDPATSEPQEPTSDAEGSPRPSLRPVRWIGDEIVVERARGGEVELAWDEVRSLDFAQAPAGARPAAARVFGSVEDGEGRTYTGYIAWNSRRVLATDVLDGYDEDGGRRRIPFGGVRAVTKTPRGALVTLASGAEIEMEGRSDVDRGHRGVRVSDLCLGTVEVEWDDFRALRLHAPANDAVAHRDAFGAAYPLSGTVLTRAGEEHAGRIRWNADKEWSWSLLEGRSMDVEFAVELGRVAKIERGKVRGATVTLVDGRSLGLGGSSDLGWDNRGILVFPSGGETERRYVPWDEFREVRFDQPTSVCDSEGERS